MIYGSTMSVKWKNHLFEIEGLKSPGRWTEIISHAKKYWLDYSQTKKNDKNIKKVKEVKELWRIVIFGSWSGFT